MLNNIYRWSFRDNMFSGIIYADNTIDAKEKIMWYLIDIFPCEEVYSSGAYAIELWRGSDENNYTDSHPGILGWDTRKRDKE